MYKTVRHGENSLQYTILPQQDGGHGIDSEAAFGGRKEATACGRSAVLVAICVVLVGGVVAAVIVPFLVSSSIVIRTPHHRPLRPTPAAPTPPPAPELVAFNFSVTTAFTDNLTASSASDVVLVVTAEPPPSAAPAEDEAPNDLSSPPTFSSSSSSTSSTSTSSSTSSTTTTTTEGAISTTSTLKTTTERRFRLAPTPASTQKTHKSWLPSKWPFVDPASTYAQWTELARQSALVPAACLGALILAVIIAVAACLATRRRRQKARRRRNVGMGTEANQSDKTTLLTEGSEVED